MLALRFNGPGIEHLAIEKIADPGTPAPDEVRVRMQASSLNGHDFNVACGRLKVTNGRVMMSDGAGEVEAVGQNVSEFKVGDSVISTFFPRWLKGRSPDATFANTPGDGIDGFGASAVVRHWTAFTHSPGKWNALEASTIPTAGVTAWRAIDAVANVQADQDVLLIGTGGVSVFALQLAKERGARIHIISSSDEKLERARELGANSVVNYGAVSDWKTEILKSTNGRGVDVVVETGGPGTLPQSIEACRIGGIVVLIGVVTGLAGTVPTALLMGRQIHLQGITVGSREHQTDFVKYLERSSMHPVIDAVYSLTEAKAAFRSYQEGRHFGKICLEY